jgi:hypothetical protein
MQTSAIGLVALGFIALGIAPRPASASERATRQASLHLTVGPGVTAWSGQDGMTFTCGDDADCRIDVRDGAVLEISATNRNGRTLRWSGCAAIDKANRCTLRVGAPGASVTVR